MCYEITREGDNGPTEVTQTFDFALIRAAEYSRKQPGSLRWFILRKDRSETKMLAIFLHGKKFDARLCRSCNGKPNGAWCSECCSLGYTEVRT